MDFFRATQIEALGAVMLESRKDVQYHLRRIFRTYSVRFNTPLHEVQNLPLVYVLQHYFESHYEEMDEEDLEQERIQLTESPEEKLARLAEEDEVDRADDEYVKKLAAEEAAKREPQGKLKDQPVADTVKRSGAPTSTEPRRLRESSLNQAPALASPPDIKLEFLDAASFERELEEDFLGKDMPKKR